MTADEQIDHIVKMMLEGEWKGSRSHRELAAGWGCHPRTVGDRAVAAAAVCRRLGGDVEERVRAKLAELEHIAEVAMGLQRPLVVKGEVELYPAPDVKAAEKAIHDYLEVLGAFNHTKKTQEVPAEPLPDEELQAKLEEALAEVKARRAAQQTNGAGDGKVH
jgi:hypothetical protein